MDEEKHGDHESQSHSHAHKKKSSLTKKIRENPWIVSSFVLAVLVVIMIVSSFGGSATGKMISEKNIGPMAVDFVNTELLQGQGSVVLSSVSKEEGFYKVSVSYNGQIVPLYFTRDGYYIGSALVSVNSVEPSESSEDGYGITPSDNPSAELYIWSYCPYGVTALKPFAEVASLLGDSANFKVNLYYAGHGDFEEQQNKIQACIQELEFNDEYWDYAQTFVDEIYEKCYGDIDCDKTESIKLMDSLGIDSNAVMACVDSQGDMLLEEDYNAAKEAGVTGSPTLVVNGVKVSASRTAEAFKGAICTAFNTVPEECGEELDSTGTTASGSC